MEPANVSEHGLLRNSEKGTHPPFNHLFWGELKGEQAMLASRLWTMRSKGLSATAKGYLKGIEETAAESGSYTGRWVSSAPDFECAECWWHSASAA
jgi:hypothetical protein